MSVAGRVFGSSGPKGSQQETNIERLYKLKECCDLLLAAGYHRARVQTLTPFDRVVGGIVWAMTNSNLEVDVDLLFTENATIGQRIAIADKLQRVLVKVKCPYALQSHQIQGLDYDRLFPVVQWLVKKAIETRRETGDLMRLQSVSQFRKSYDAFVVSDAVLTAAAAELKTDARTGAAAAAPAIQTADRARDVAEPSKRFVLAEVGATYRPKRKFKKREAAVFDSIASRTEATLLEYGENIVSAAATEEDTESADARAEQRQRRGGVANKNLEEKEAAAAKAEAEARAKAKAEHERKMKELQSNLEGGTDGDRVTGRTAGGLISLSADQIKASIAAAAAADAAADGAGGAGGGAGVGKDAWRSAFQRQMQNLENKIAAEEKKLAAKQAELAAMQQQAAEMKGKVDGKVEEKNKLLADGERLNTAMNSSANQAILQKLKALVTLNETLKQSEAQFKLNCKQQRKELEAQLAALEGGANADEELVRVQQVEQLYNTEVDRHQKLRSALAKKNQEISRISRLIDEIPTRPELLQYERRFVELYELVAAKLKETKKYFDLYNMLGDSYKHMSTEVSVLNSITEGFPKAMKSEKGKASFLESFKEILGGVQKTLDHADKQLGGVVAERELRTEKYNQLLEKQRNYFKAVKEFQDECFRNERLQESIERFTRAAAAEASASEQPATIDE